MKFDWLAKRQTRKKNESQCCLSFEPSKHVWNLCFCCPYQQYCLKLVLIHTFLWIVIFFFHASSCIAFEIHPYFKAVFHINGWWQWLWWFRTKLFKKHKDINNRTDYLDKGLLAHSNNSSLFCAGDILIYSEIYKNNLLFSAKHMLLYGFLSPALLSLTHTHASLIQPSLNFHVTHTYMFSVQSSVYSLSSFYFLPFLSVCFFLPHVHIPSYTHPLNSSPPSPHTYIPLSLASNSAFVDCSQQQQWGILLPLLSLTHCSPVPSPPLSHSTHPSQSFLPWEPLVETMLLLLRNNGTLVAH